MSSQINRLIAAGTNQNYAAPVIAGLQARGQMDTRNLANESARNELEKQSNVNRLLQSQGQQLLDGGIQTETPLDGSTGGQTPDFSQLLTQADKDQVKLLMASGDVAGLNELRNNVLKRGQASDKLKIETDKTKMTQESGLRKEFDKASGEFTKVRDAYTRILKSAENPSPAGDLALIFNFMKVLDPGSTVREGEFNTAANAQAALGRAEGRGEVVPNFVQGAIKRLTEGTLLLPKQRADFVGRAGSLYGGAQQLQQQSVERFTGIAERGQLNPQNIVFEFKVGGGKKKTKPVEELTTQDFNDMDINDLRDFIENHPDNQ